MKKYAILMALAAMLCGTEAGAVTLGFDQVTGGFSDVNGDGNPDPGEFRVVTPGVWSLQGDDLFSLVDSTSSIAVHGIPTVIDARNEYPEFTFHGVDLYTKDNAEVQFNIVGYEVSHDLHTAPLLFSYSILVKTFDRLVVTDSLMDINNRRLDQKIGQLVISAENSGIGVGCLRFGYGAADPACASPSGGGGSNGTGVPEPASLLLLGAGLAGIGIWRRKVRG